MKGTDTFHLGDGYYVYVNYAIISDGYICDIRGSTRVKTYAAWVGEQEKSIEIEKTVLWFGSMARVYDTSNEELIDSEHLAKVKFGLGELLMTLKEKLKEIIGEEQLWNHLLDPTT